MQKIYFIFFLFTFLPFSIYGQTSINDSFLEDFLESAELAQLNHSSNEIHVFPSVITDNFQVSLNQQNTQATVQLFNLDGEKILEQDISNEQSNIVAYGLDDDIYMVNILDLRGEVIHSEWIVVEK